MDGVLGAANSADGRASEPWSLAHFHRPLYCSNNGECKDDGGMDKILRNQVGLLLTLSLIRSRPHIYSTTGSRKFLC